MVAGMGAKMVTRGCGRLGLLLLAGGLLRAAAPVFLAISGPALKERMVLASPVQATCYCGPVAQFMQAAVSGEYVTVDPESLKGRPYLDLRFYWGPEWVRYAEAGGRGESLRPDQANQRGRFYPAAGSMPAIVEVDASPDFPGKPVDSPYRTISDRGLQMLKELGLPVRIDR